jgi:NAD dependent epimerase/dehydratase family enzyme
MKVPKSALRLQLGEGAQVLTEGQAVLPERMIQSGFSFSFNYIEDAVKDCVS